MRKKRYTWKEKLEFAAKLRANPTKAEEVLWKAIQNIAWPGKVRWRFQAVLAGFIPDFFEPETKIVLEVDGSVHRKRSVKAADRRKNRVLEQHGFAVIRFTNAAVLKNPEKVLSTILTIVRKRLSQSR